MTDTPEHPQEQASEQDQSLEAQLDALLSDLEAVDPQSVPSDLRKHRDKPEPKPAPPQPVAAPQQAPMPEPEPQPIQAPVTPSEPQPIIAEDTQPKTAPTKQSLDLETIASMASNLLDQQIEATIESASSLTGAKPADVGTGEDQGQAEPDEPAVEASRPKTSKPLSDNELGDQIQALLNDVQTQQAQPLAASPPAASESEPPPVTAEVATQADEAPEAGVVSIQQIDAMLAESAEQAIEAEPDPSERVPGTDEIFAAEQQAEAQAAEARARVTAEAEAQALASSAQAEAAHEPVPQPVPAEPQPQPTQSFSADADDVARELDEEPQPAPSPSPAASPVEAVIPQAEPASVQEVSHEPAEAVVPQANLKKAELAMLHLCGTINRPLNRLSPEMRDLVGWVGVVTVGLGFFVLLYGVLF